MPRNQAAVAEPAQQTNTDGNTTGLPDALQPGAELRAAMRGSTRAPMPGQPRRAQHEPTPATPEPEPEQAEEDESERDQETDAPPEESQTDEQDASPTQETDDEAAERTAAAEPEALDETAVSIARSLGLSDDEINNFGSNAALQSAINLIHRSIGQVGQPAPATAAPTEQQPAATQPPAPTPAQQAPQQPPQHQPPAQDWQPELGEDYADLAPTLKGMHGDITRRVANAVNHDLQQVAQTINALQLELGLARSREIDTVMSSLPDELKQVYGRGATYSLPKDSQEFAARKALIDAANQIYYGYVNRQLVPPDYKELMQFIIRGKHSDTLQKNTVRKIARQAAGGQPAVDQKPRGAKAAGKKSAADEALQFMNNHPLKR